MLSEFKKKFSSLLNKKSNVLIGMSLHANVVRAVKLEKGATGSQVTQCGEFPVMNEQMWPEAICSLAKTFDVETATVNLVLPPHRYQVMQIDKPSVPENELQEALPWAIKELVSFPVDQLTFDYFDIPVTSIGDKLNIVATQREVLLPIIDTLAKTELDLDVITIEEVVNFRIRPVTEISTMFVTQSEGEEICVQIVKEGKLFFSRRLRGFARIGNYTAEEIVMGIADALNLELQRSVDYYESQLKQTPIQAVLVNIASEHSAVLVEKLNQDMAVEVSMFSAPEHLIDETPVTPEYLLALGGALARSVSAGGAHA